MEQKIYDYRSTEEIKTIVMGVQELRCRRDVERERYEDRRTGSELVKLAKRKVKNELLDMVSHFIFVKDSPDGRQVEAEVYLPYVKDSVVKGLERDNKSVSVLLSHAESVNALLRKEIKLLRRPWWKKLFSALKGERNG